MAPSSIYDTITREHPAYRIGFNAGRDTGLTIALTAITTERAHQERLTAGSEGCRVYADGVLSTLAKVIAARFRDTR
jgi:hypothetical protein